MNVMYIKYKNSKMQSIISKGDAIIINNSKVIPFKKIEKAAVYNNTTTFTTTSSNDLEDILNEEITNYFLNAIHRNYLLNRK